MSLHCHRCQNELPDRGGTYQSGDEGALFCPHCSAPQLLLPDHMRIEYPVEHATTGMLPPPLVGARHGREVDWPTALPKAAGVAVAGAVLTLVGLKVNVLALLGLCWLLGGALVSLGLYSRRRPRVWIDGRIGLRIGVVTGLLTLAALAISGAATGVVMRFSTHRLQAFDQRNAEQAKLAQAWGVRWLQEQHQDKQVQETYIRFVNSPGMTSPEMRAGTALAQLGFEGVLFLFVSAGGGALAGLVQRRRGAAMQGG